MIKEEELVRGFEFIYDAPLNGDQTDCYDKFSNRIEGEICIVEGRYDTKEGALLSGILIMLLLGIMFGFMGKMVDDFSFGGIV